MRHIVLLGMNHRTAPIEMREQLAVSCQLQVSPLQLIPHLPHVDEVFFLSTCNRVEILFTCHNLNAAIREVKGQFLAYLGNPSERLLDAHLYFYENLEAVKHLFRVSSSLDSMVVGEPQILGQIKAAYRQAAECRTVGVILNRLLHKSFSVAKRVRSETMVGSHAVSISYAAVEMARKIFGELKDKRVLLVGAGEMAELAAGHFLAQGVRHITVTNRTPERAFELARQFKADTIPFEHLVEGITSMDIVLTSTGSPYPLLRYQDVKSRMRERRNRPLFFIDIAVPRDVEARINEIDNVYLYDIDDLQGIIDLNREDRKREAEKAEHIVSEEITKFQKWLDTLDVVPTIIALRQKAETIRQGELQRTFTQLSHLSERERQAIEVLTGSILKKMLHDPILFLKKKANRESKELFVDYTQQLMTIDPSNASLILVNTCGFLESAVQEAIHTILDLARHKTTGPCERLIVAGCMVQRYGKKLLKLLPEVDCFIGVEYFYDLGRILPNCVTGGSQSLWISSPRFLFHSDLPRFRTTPAFTAYVKIAEGCSNHCTYCLIPHLRGPYRSRTVDDILEEARRLSGEGVKEINLVAQDTTAFGSDRTDPNALIRLLESLDVLDGIVWIRLLYAYPDRITIALLQTMAQSRKIVPYLDIPFQHCVPRILTSMGRATHYRDHEELIDLIRYHIPVIALRTSLIVGFPGETEADFQALIDFVKRVEFDHLGVFEFSPETGTSAARFSRQIARTTKERRRKTLLKLQRSISKRRLTSLIGQVVPVLIEGLHPETELLLNGRLATQAPEVDGTVIVTSGQANIGDIVLVQIKAAHDYDLVAEICKPSRRLECVDKPIVSAC